MNVIEALLINAERQPHHEAYAFVQNRRTEIDRLTYLELAQAIQANAANLQYLGVAGERALLLYPPGLDFVVAFFACLAAEVIAVPAYPPPRPNLSMQKLRAIAADAQPALVLTTSSLLPNLKHQLAQYPELTAMHWLATDTIPISELASNWQKPNLKGETLAFLQYTSGSTGMPKGVMVSHRNLEHNLSLIHRSFEHTSTSQGLIWLPSYHDMGLIGGIIEPVYGGFPVCLMSPMDFLQRPICWLQAISQTKATTSGGPNFAYDLCVRSITPEQRSTLDLSSWEVAFIGAEPIRAKTLDEFAAKFESCGFRREAFYSCYGMAEATLFISGGLKTAPPIIRYVEAAALERNHVVESAANNSGSRPLVGCGHAWSEQEIVIVDPESLTPCLAGQVGEIWVSSPSVAQGYWNRPIETEQTFNAQYLDADAKKFLRTGDLGFLQDGELFVTGRWKDIIIIRGRNHYPQDIEFTVEQCNLALSTGYGAAFGVEVDGQEELVVLQEVRRDYLKKLEVANVIGDIRQAVVAQHGLQVSAVILLKPGSLPKTSSGKVKRKACREKFLSGDLSGIREEENSEPQSKLPADLAQPVL